MLLDDEAVEKIRARVRLLSTQGVEPGSFCSFMCSFSDSAEAQHAACLAANGVYCRLIETVIDKGAPCRVRALLDL